MSARFSGSESLSSSCRTLKRNAPRTHLKKQLLPRQSMFGDLAVLPAELLHASPLPVVLIKDVQRTNLAPGRAASSGDGC